MKLVILIATVMLTSLVIASEPERAFSPVSALDIQGMIIPQELANDFGLPFKTFWTPLEAQIKELELRLPKYLESRIKAGPRSAELRDVSTNLPQYRRQYVGVFKNGRRLIYVNALRPKPASGVDIFEDWDRRFIDVSDGGSQFWNATYDVEKNVFREINVNGRS